MKHNLKTFEQNNYDNDKMKFLENEIIKRDQLIYTMMKGLSFSYPEFMVNSNMGIDELRKRFKVEEVINKSSERILKRIYLLHSYLFK